MTQPMTSPRARSGPHARRNRRTRMLADGRHPKEIVASLRRRPETAGLVALVPLLTRLDHLITQAGVIATLQQALLGMALGCGLSVGLLRLAAPQAPASALIAAAALGVGLPVVYLIRRRSQRRLLFEEQLPDALDLLGRRLRRGDPVNAALASVARDMPGPVGSEFGIVVDEISLGVPLDDALERLNGRIDLPDLRGVTIALGIQQASGGHLAGMLDGLAKLSRSQSRARASPSSFSET